MSWAHFDHWGDLVPSGSPEASARGAATTLRRLGSGSPFDSLEDAVHQGGRNIRAIAREGLLALNPDPIILALASVAPRLVGLDALNAARVAWKVGVEIDREWDAYYESESRSFEVDDDE